MGYSYKPSAPPEIRCSAWSLQPDSLNVSLAPHRHAWECTYLCQPSSTYARKEKGRNLISPSENHRIGLRGVNRQSKISTAFQYNQQLWVQLIQQCLWINSRRSNDIIVGISYGAKVFQPLRGVLTARFQRSGDRTPPCGVPLWTILRQFVPPLWRSPISV